MSVGEKLQLCIYVPPLWELDLNLVCAKDVNALVIENRPNIFKIKTMWQTVDGTAKYDLVLKVKRSDKEEKFKANVHKDKDGNFHVNNMVQDHS